MKKKNKHVKCRDCGARYRARELRCPACEAPNPMPLGSGLTGADRIVGVSLIVIGAALAVPAFWFVYLMLRYGSLRGKAVSFTLAIVPVGAIFNGILLVNGVHPRDFYSWWDRRTELQRLLIWGTLAVAGLGIVLLFMFGGSAPRADVVEMIPIDDD